MEIRNRMYRVSTKALILNDARDKFLLVREADGTWELPGGGLDWGESPIDGIRREILEEMGIPVMWVSSNPSYFFTCTNSDGTLWLARVIYEAKLEHLNFVPSEECVEIKFISPEEVRNEQKVFPDIYELAKVFNPGHHKQ